MSKYFALAFAVGAAAATVLLALPLGSARAALLLLCGLLAGGALAFSLLKGPGRARALPVLGNLKFDDKNAESIAALGKLFEATMSRMREGVLVIDQEMRVVASNRAARNVFTYIQGKPESRYLTELTHNQSICDAFVDALNGQERAEIKVETFGPERRIFDLRVMPLGLGDGRGPRGAIGVFFDITRLERLERVRQEFLSNVSHELRTPLAAILAFVETLEDGAIDDHENNRRFLSIIRKNAARMHTLIDDILELGAIEAGNVTIKPAQVSLHQVVADVFLAVAGKADARRITLHNEVNHTASVHADEHRLEQMLTNLVDNAIKFNRDGGVVTIRHEPGPFDVITVADKGEGIPAEHIERLFERFYRVDKARSREMGGTGLGLAIVKHLARAHGGEVTVQSKLGEGSTFVIKLPGAGGGAA